MILCTKCGMPAAFPRATEEPYICLTCQTAINDAKALTKPTVSMSPSEQIVDDLGQIIFRLENNLCYIKRHPEVLFAVNAMQRDLERLKAIKSVLPEVLPANAPTAAPLPLKDEQANV